MMMAMFPMEVLQTPRQMTIIQEAYNQIRRIYLDDTLPAVEDAEPGFWGHSVGRWEGNDFVVETIGIKDYVRFRGAPHSAEHAHPRAHAQDRCRSLRERGDGRGSGVPRRRRGSGSGSTSADPTTRCTSTSARTTASTRIRRRAQQRLRIDTE